MEEVSCTTSHLMQQASKIIVLYKNLNLEAASKPSPRIVGGGAPHVVI